MLLAGMALGGTIYVAVILGLWYGAGAPAGVETTIWQGALRWRNARRRPREAV
jgi:hypothetical protein